MIINYEVSHSSNTERNRERGVVNGAATYLFRMLLPSAGLYIKQ